MPEFSTVRFRGIGDDAEIAGQQHLHRHDMLPIGVFERDLCGVVLGLDVFGCLCQPLIEVIEDFR